MKAAFIGRFQPFHLGHKKVVEKYSKEFEEFCIVIGGSEKDRGQKNPLTGEERKKIIESCHQDTEIYLLPDHPSNDVWSDNLIEKTGCNAVLTRNDYTENAVKESSDLEVINQEVFQREMYSGTEVRRRIRSGEEWRYLIPNCARNSVEKHLKKIKKTGPNYEFKPGWKKENMQN
ncbi:MAG: adenylyltransferase/cytidyltransferase family protein [Candidatus Nanohalobium sp.]